MAPAASPKSKSESSTPLLGNVSSHSTGEGSGDPHHGNQCYNMVLDFISILVAVSEIGLVLYLSITHFSHSQGVIALAMLGPIFLNFVGVSYFLSNHEERKILEQKGSSRCAKDIFQVPVFGPVFTAIQVFSISSGISKAGDYARFEALAIKMRQAESFFGAAPEALVQLTVLLVAEEQQLTLNQYLEITIVILSVITLSEANMYALSSNYFRLFHTYGPDDWKLPHLAFWQKCILFFHAFFSIGSRLAAMACLKAAVKYFVFNPPATPGARMTSSQANELGYYLAVFFLVEIGFRMLVYYVVRLIKYTIIDEGIPSGCYESISFGWRSTILDLGYQSKNIAVQIWFYAENAICFIIWWVVVSRESNGRPMIRTIKDNVLAPLAAIFVLFTLISIFLLFAATGLKLHTLRGPFAKKQKKKRMEIIHMQ